MDWKDLKNAAPEALARSLEEARTHLRSLHNQLSSHQLTKVREVREARKQIARIKTLLQQKQAKP